jgi:hypothetical protein
MNANIAAGITAVIRHLKAHRLSTTALIVGDSRTGSRTGRGMLASRAIRHVENKIEISIEGD